MYKLFVLLAVVLSFPAFDGCVTQRSSLTVDAKTHMSEGSSRPEVVAHVAYKIEFGGE